ncbi:glycosyltransferase [uncultured Sphingomonas sp.]|uniref:glycosyltransferase family 2 protein n=1 Tax=uncultured Sphingomonas sp. TaxID=158754 RepID=UPI00262FCA8C|nr:glycosyltransferase [uncultured Sphingomonas sp.]
MTDVSLLICTRNRSASLVATLASVAHAATCSPEVAVEVILVDNGSSDDTPTVLAAWRAAQSFPVRLIREDRPGLAAARNAGLAQARGRIIAMTDDDCVLHRDYFAALVRVFAEVQAPAVIGGRILLGDPRDLMVTVKLEDHPMVADPRGFPGGFVMGANLAFGADVLAMVGSFDERFGAGARFIAAEDTDFLFRATGLGVPLRYDPRITVDHHHGRRDRREERRLLTGYSFGDGALYAKHLFRDTRVIRAILRDIADLRHDLIDPVTTHADIRRFYRFRLMHKARGLCAYWCRPRSHQAIAIDTVA